METINDIVKQMRYGVVPKHDHDHELLWFFADRIEKATANCNCLKLREALNEAQKRLEQMVGCDMHRYYREAQTCDGQTTTGDCGKMETCKVIFQIRSALSTQPRNCDVGTAEEQAKRFNDFCIPQRCTNCPLFTVGGVIGECGIRWAQLPYESEVGEVELNSGLDNDTEDTQINKDDKDKKEANND